MAQRVLGFLAAVALAAGGFVVTASTAQAAPSISGQITCVANQPMGAWVTANSGGSNWAGWSRAGSTNTINYNKSLPNGGSWYMSIGCGGSTQSWGKVTYTDTYSGGGQFNFTCYDIRNAGFAYLRCQKT